MSNNDFADVLRIAVARHIGPPGTIHDLQRLTGGANKTTWSFDAEVNGARRPFILQIASTRVIDESDPIAAVSPHLTAEEDARLMIAAVKAKVPAPKVRAILDPGDGLGNGYVTERVAGETLATRILREQRYASARDSMATQCGAILPAIHRIPATDMPFLNRLEPAEHVAVEARISGQ